LTGFCSKEELEELAISASRWVALHNGHCAAGFVRDAHEIDKADETICNNSSHME
jgi:hypothetical protein